MQIIYVLEAEEVDDAKVILKYEFIDENIVDKLVTEKYEISLLDEIRTGSIEISSETKNYQKYIGKYLKVNVGNRELRYNDLLSSKFGGGEVGPRKLIKKFVSIRPNFQTRMARVEPSNNEDNPWYVCFLNMGRGDSSFVRCPKGKNYLFDAGDGVQNAHIKVNAILDEINRIQPNVEPADRSLSGLFISHPDNDHSFGVRNILGNLSFHRGSYIYANQFHTGPERWLDTLIQIKNHPNTMLVGVPSPQNIGTYQYLIPSLKFNFLWPNDTLKFSPQPRTGVSHVSPNDSSHLITLSDLDDKWRFNFFGDAEKDAWTYFFSRHIITNNLGLPTFFKYSHHGRRSASPYLASLGQTVGDFMRTRHMLPAFVSNLTNCNYFCKSVNNPHTMFTTQAPNGIILKIDGNNVTQFLV